ncbi:Pectate lyase [Forsythia ovata]|uniref:Pectate lyase n=1 Tax=Forsythia ovata TaxID=205694 RepID=A0ABD1R2D7_9LAMI
MYAIGGSAAPTINSQGNRFLAPNNIFSKEVTKHEYADESEWKNWNWRSEGDLMLNGAYFRPSGAGASSSYAKASSLSARPSSLVSSITSGAGALKLNLPPTFTPNSLIQILVKKSLQLDHGIQVQQLRRPKVVRWTKPPSGWLKLNTDGCFIWSLSAGGGILRNEDDYVIFAFHEFHDDTWCITLEAELRALLTGLKPRFENGYLFNIWADST